MEHAEMIERLTEKTTLGEEEARSALEQNGWNLLDALIAEERAGRLKGKSNSYRTDEDRLGERQCRRRTLGR